MEPILGIDLGTTNSAVSVIIDGQPKVLPIGNELILPSCVGLDAENHLIVGRRARNQIVSSPERTVSSIKRKMGEPVRVLLGDKEFSPEEISSFILRELASQAAQALGKPIHRAVVTVPAYFNEQQRKATQDAGALAGLEVVRMIHEPTAAAIAYDANRSGSEKLLVYDLGGGTFDASLVLVEDGIVEVKASHGDTHLGGDDFDQLLVEHVLKHFRNQHQVDLSSDPRVQRRLAIVLERAKCHLSDHPFVSIREEFIWNDRHLELEITRDEYEDLIRPLLERTLESVHKCLRDARLLPSDLNKVMLVGGSSRTPLVHRLLAGKLGLEPRFEVDPELVVAMGASIQAGMIAGQKTESILVDITPHAFGTSAAGMLNGEPRLDLYVPIIPRNTPIPTRKSEVFYTMVDHQEQVEVEIYEGEAPVAGQNLLLGKFRIEGLSHVPAGNPIVLNLDLDVNGMLKVTAEEKRTALSRTVTLDTRTARSNLNLDHAKKRISDFLRHVESEDEPRSLALDPGAEDGAAGGAAADGASSAVPSPKASGARLELIEKARSLRQRAEKLMSTSLDEADRQEIHQLLHASSEAIHGEDWVGLTRCVDTLSDLVFYLED